MPHWCDTSVKFLGHKDNIERLYHDWVAAINNIEVGDGGWLGRLLIYHRINPDIIKCSGFVKGIWLTDNILEVESDDAWAPMVDFYEFIAALYNVNYVYEAEEPGSEIYINTDKDDLFFKDWYKIEMHGTPVDDEIVQELYELSLKPYYENFEDIVQYLWQYDIYSEEDLQKLVNQLNAKYPEIGLKFIRFEGGRV